MQTYFKLILKADYVFDIDFARDLALFECAKSFVRNYQSQKMFPLLTSSCPGFICYAEKTHGDILPFIDTTKSPQQIMGSIVKDYMAKSLGINPAQIYHTSIMPCYDKKLEASRIDFYNEANSVREVDLVLSTIEIENMMNEQGISLCSIEESDFHSEFIKGDSVNLYPSEGSTSGGYLSFVLRFAVYKLYGINISSLDIENGTNGISISHGRNSDYTTIQYTPPNETSPTLTFAYCYGFRNIQNLVRKLKPKKAMNSKSKELHYVEVMACPGGCTNGGGQLKPESHSDPQTQKDLLSKVNMTYKESLHAVSGPEQSGKILDLYTNWLGGEDSSIVMEKLHTQYHAVEGPITNGLAVKW